MLIRLAIISILSLSLTGCSLSSKKDGGVFKTKDQGENWERSITIQDDQDTLANANVLKIKNSAFDPNITYLATEKRGLYKSDNFGDSWKRLLSQITQVFDLEVSHFRDNVVYASVILNDRGKIIMTENGGQEWREIYSETARDTYISHLLINPFQDQSILALNSAGFLMASQNDGSDWQGIYNFEDPVISIVFGKTSDTILALTRRGVWKSEDKGKNFKLISKEQQELEQARSYQLLTHSNENIFLSTDIGFFISKDYGGTWQKIVTLNNPGTYPIRYFQAFPDDPEKHWMVVAGLAGYITKDQGNSWKSIQFETSRLVSNILINKEDPNNILIGVGQSSKKGLFKL